MDKYFHESEESASYKNKLYQYYKQRNNLVYGSNYETLKDRIDAKINEIENEYSLSLRKDIILLLFTVTEGQPKKPASKALADEPIVL